MSSITINPFGNGGASQSMVGIINAKVSEPFSLTTTPEGVQRLTDGLSYNSPYPKFNLNDVSAGAYKQQWSWWIHPHSFVCKRREMIVWGCTAGIIAGAVKEWCDNKYNWEWDWKDFVATCIGAIIAVLLILGLHFGRG